MTSRSRLLHALDKLETERQDLLAQLDSASDTRIETAPGPGKWSIAQIILHLAIAEEGALAYLKKKLAFSKHRPAAFTSSLRLMALHIAFGLPIKFKAPAFLGAMPHVGAKEARDRWDLARRALREAYLAVPEEAIGHELFRHPAAGKLNLVQGVGSIALHARRHAKQVERILRTMPDR